MAFQPPINDFTQKSKKKLAKIAENPQYFTTFIVFNNKKIAAIRRNNVQNYYRLEIWGDSKILFSFYMGLFDFRAMVGLFMCRKN